MKTNWPTKKLGEVCEIITGNTPKTAIVEYYGDDFLWAGPSDLEQGMYILSTKKKLSDKGFNESGIRKLPEGSVLMSCIGNIGKLGIATEQMSSNQQINTFVPNVTVLDSKYLYYILKTKVKDFENASSKTTVPIINKTKCSKIEIPLPPLEEQKRVVNVLEEKLGKVKQAIQLRQDAIADTEKILSAKLTEIFTEGKEKGWQLREIQDIARVINGRAYKQSELLNEGKYRVLRVGNFFTNKSWYYSDLELDEDKYCDNGDLLYAWSASFGPRIWEGEKVIYHYHIWKIVPGELISKFYLKYLLDEITEEMKEKGGRGATMAHLTKGNFEKVTIPVPDLKTQEKIVKELDELSTRVAELRSLQDEQLSDLKSLERAYLHEAFNGELV